MYAIKISIQGIHRLVFWKQLNKLKQVRIVEMDNIERGAN